MRTEGMQSKVAATEGHYSVRTCNHLDFYRPASLHMQTKLLKAYFGTFGIEIPIYVL